MKFLDKKGQLTVRQLVIAGLVLAFLVVGGLLVFFFSGQAKELVRALTGWF